MTINPGDNLVEKVAEDLDLKGADRWLNAYVGDGTIVYTIGARFPNGDQWEIMDISEGGLRASTEINIMPIVTEVKLIYQFPDVIGDTVIDDEYLTTGEVAKMLKYNRRYVSRLCKTRQIKAVKPIAGGLWRIPKKEVERILTFGIEK